MKSCPKCNTQYTDDSLRFCLQDGSPLLSLQGSGTFVRGDSATATRSENRDDLPYTEEGQESEITQVSRREPVEKKRNTAIVVILTALLTVAIVAAVGAWLYSRSGENRITKKANTSAGNAAVNSLTPDEAARNSPTPIASPTRLSNSNVSNRSNEITASDTNDVDKERIKEEVSNTIVEWESAAESGDIISLMDNYAGTVDYYTNRGVGIGTVRRDKQRAFATYDSIDFDISNMSVTTDSSGNTATAVFDKGWVFEGSKNSSGKVRSQLQLRRENGKWLITGERDLKVYYME